MIRILLWLAAIAATTIGGYYVLDMLAEADMSAKKEPA